MKLFTDPIINLRGEKIALGPFKSEHVPLYHRWMNDFVVTVTGEDRVAPHTHESMEDWYKERVRSTNDVNFIIYEPVDGDTMSAHEWRPIGTAGLMHIAPHNRTAEFGIGIGERDCWGKGYGTDAARLLLDYGFNILALHNIGLLCYASNLAGIKAYERAGFKHAGVMHSCCWVNGKFEDMVMMDCLATEFGPSRVLDQMQAPQARR